MARDPALDQAPGQAPINPGPVPPRGWRALLGGRFTAVAGCECQMLAMMMAERCATKNIAEKDAPKPKIAER